MEISKFVVKSDRSAGNLESHLQLVFEVKAVLLGTLPLNLWDRMQTLDQTHYVSMAL